MNLFSIVPQFPGEKKKRKRKETHNKALSANAGDCALGLSQIPLKQEYATTIFHCM